MVDFVTDKRFLVGLAVGFFLGPRIWTMGVGLISKGKAAVSPTAA